MSQTWEMEYVKMYVFFFLRSRNARNIRNGNAVEKIEKEKHFTAISIGLYSLNCLANIFFFSVLFVESAYNNLHLAEKKSCVTSSTANSVKLVEN